jgi:hypothetical protein
MDNIDFKSPILIFFEYGHLPGNLQRISKYFWDLAIELEATIPDSAEKSTGLRKLLEAKDCMVRAAL